VGSFLAAIPGVLIALIQLGPGKAAVITVGYLMINVAIGNFLEPRVMGKGMGLSPMIIVISLIFWGWVLGPVGMLLSVPLTMTVRIALESIEETQGIGMLLGARVPPEPAAAEGEEARADAPPEKPSKEGPPC
jgi:predicted PurR-regulated permease PerM